MTSSNGNIFRVTGPLCGNSPVTGEFPSQRPVRRGFDVFFDLHLNKQFSKQPWGWWFETPSRSLWRHCNEIDVTWASWRLKSPATNSTVDSIYSSCLQWRKHQSSALLALCSGGSTINSRHKLPLMRSFHVTTSSLSENHGISGTDTTLNHRYA